MDLTETRPDIVGPEYCCRCGPPPRFQIDAGPLALYMVELAREPELIAGLAGRTGDNYFFGGDLANVFATGPVWCTPPAVWAALSAAPRLYYRVAALNPHDGLSRLSVEDDALKDLPAITVDHRFRAGSCTRH